MSNPTQCDRILEWLQSGKKITALDALREFGCFRLAARIKDLKDLGHKILTEGYTYENSFGEKKTIARYYMRPF